MTESVSNGQILFSIGQTGIKGQIHQNSGYQNEIELFLDRNGNFLSKIIKYSKNENTVKKEINNFLPNSYTLKGFTYQIQDNQIQSEYTFDLRQQTIVSNLRRIVEQLESTSVLVIGYYLRDNHIYNNDLFDMFLERFDIGLPKSGVNFLFCQIISGKTKQTIASAIDYKLNDCTLKHQYNDINDMIQSGYGKNIISSSLKNFNTKNFNQTIINQYQIPENCFGFLLSGSIRKNTQIIQSHADAKFIIKFYNNSSLVQEDSESIKSSGIFQQFNRYFEVPGNSNRLELLLEHSNAITIPGDLEVKNLEMYKAFKNYTHQSESDNHLVQISNIGIETQKYSEQIGFDFNSIDQYKEEFEQNFNLYKGKRLPQIVEEPIKFFNGIIDQNKRIVNKSLNQEQMVQLPEIELNPHKSYIIGMWINSKKSASINLSISLKNQNLLRFPLLNEQQDITNILVDQNENSNKNFKFYWTVIYPYGQRNLSNQDAMKIYDKIKQQVDNINQEVQDKLFHQFSCFNTKENVIIQPKINFLQKNHDGIDGQIVMPIAKELQIATFDTNEVISFNLEDHNFNI